LPIILRPAKVIITIFIAAKLIRILRTASTVPTPQVLLLLASEEVAPEGFIATLIVSKLFFQKAIGLTHIKEPSIGRFVVIFVQELGLFLGKLAGRVDKIGRLCTLLIWLRLLLLGPFQFGLFGIIPGKGEGAGAAGSMMNLSAETTGANQVIRI
jgi:hypothetical protein